jgi:hypothetical protein
MIHDDADGVERQGTDQKGERKRIRPGERMALAGVASRPGYATGARSRRLTPPLNVPPRLGPHRPRAAAERSFAVLSRCRMSVSDNCLRRGLSTFLVEAVASSPSSAPLVAASAFTPALPFRRFRTR